MNANRELVTTSVSIPSELLERAKTRAAASYRTFSQYVSYLLDQDLTLAESESVRRAANDPPVDRSRRV